MNDLHYNLSISRIHDEHAEALWKALANFEIEGTADVITLTAWRNTDLLVDEPADHVSLQDALQREVFNLDYSAMSDEERIVHIKDNVLALVDELHEALGEVGWKPWATSRHVNREALQGELIDAYHFLLNLFLLSGMDADLLHERFTNKQAINRARQERGYDGVTGKCSTCGRALDDPGVECTLDTCRENDFDLLDDI